jgi:hypothetical protein
MCTAIPPMSSPNSSTSPVWTYARLVGHLYAAAGDLAEAKDAVQEAFDRAVVRRPRIRGYDLPEALVRRIAVTNTSTGSGPPGALLRRPRRRRPSIRRPPMRIEAVVPRMLRSPRLLR